VDTIALFADLFRHMLWADALIWQAILAVPSALTDHTIRDRLHHIHLCQRAWLRIWLAQPVDPHDGESLDLVSLASWALQYHEEVARYLARLQETDIDVKIAVPDIEEEPRQPLLWETFLQITGHSTYHRGQVSTRLRDIGGEPPRTDYIRWVVLGKPKGEWPKATGEDEKAGR
jgi:uncharacterized damage-inducible protein DinB